MIRHILLTLSALFLSVPLAGPAHANDLEGAWALRIDDATIFRFELRQIDEGVWRGTWSRPDTFGSNGVVFTGPEGEEELSSMAGLDIDGDVELSFADPRPGAIPDIFRFRHIGPGQAEMTYVGTDLAPYPLVQVASGAPLGPFDTARIYDRDNAQIFPDDGEDGAAEQDLGADEFRLEDQPASIAQTGNREPAAQIEEDNAPEQAEAEVAEVAEAEPAEAEAAAQEPARSRIGDDFLEGF